MKKCFICGKEIHECDKNNYCDNCFYVKNTNTIIRLRNLMKAQGMWWIITLLVCIGVCFFRISNTGIIPSVTACVVCLIGAIDSFGYALCEKYQRGERGSTLMTVVCWGIITSILMSFVVAIPISIVIVCEIKIRKIRDKSFEE